MEIIKTIGELIAWEPYSILFWIKVLLAVIMGIILNVIVSMLLTPLFIDYLVNRNEGTDPEEKSGFHLFTYIEEGKVKIIVKGDIVVRMIMVYAGHSFARTGNEDSAEYWEIIETPGESENPMRDISPFFRLWAEYVYATTGAVFTGIYPFQTVREYPLERTKMHLDEKTESEARSFDADKGLQGNNTILEVKEDISDHLRARQFLYPLRIAAADTKDKISLNILVVINAHVTNPHKAAFATDRWDHKLTNLVTNTITNYTRLNNHDSVLSAKSEGKVDGLNQAVLAIKDDQLEYGIEIDGVDIRDISPNLSDEEKTKLYAEALAKSLGRAIEIEGKSRANAIRALNKAHAEGGEFALETQRYEALVRAAEAAKGGTVLLPMGGSSSDPTVTAILAEMKKNGAKTS